MMIGQGDKVAAANDVSEADFVYFQDHLLDATRTVFSNFQKENPEEHFYGFGLLHEPLWAYITAIANSEEGLVRKANEYKVDKYNLGYAARPLNEIMAELRWSSGDWDYLNAGLDGFEALNEWMKEKDFYWKYPDNEASWEQFDLRMISICHNVLKQLESEGLFGIAETRNQVVINIMMGDQDPSWLLYAQALNPHEVYQRWLDELNQTGRSY